LWQLADTTPPPPLPHPVLEEGEKNKEVYLQKHEAKSFRLME
jgi:hypothetical protein